MFFLFCIIAIIAFAVIASAGEPVNRRRNDVNLKHYSKEYMNNPVVNRIDDIIK